MSKAIGKRKSHSDARSVVLVRSALLHMWNAGGHTQVALAAAFRVRPTIVAKWLRQWPPATVSRADRIRNDPRDLWGDEDLAGQGHIIDMGPR